MAALNHKQAGAEIAFSEKKLTLTVLARHCPLRKKLEFGLGESVKDGHTSKGFQSVLRMGH
jgi:hypothetical protein